MISTNRLPYHCIRSRCALILRGMREDRAATGRRRRPSRKAQALGRALIYRWRGVPTA